MQTVKISDVSNLLGCNFNLEGIDCFGFLQTIKSLGVLGDNNLTDYVELYNQLRNKEKDFVKASSDVSPIKPKVKVLKKRVVEKKDDGLLKMIFREYDGEMRAVYCYPNSNGGYLIKKGTRAKFTETKSLQGSYKKCRASLFGSGVLIKDLDGELIFAADYEFTSLSQAASVIVGATVNGLNAFKVVSEN
jgi:hypothetical protein